MARRRRRASDRRDVRYIANETSLPRLLSPVPLTLGPTEDRREYHPSGPLRPARTFTSSSAPVLVRNRPAKGRAAKLYGYQNSQTKAVRAFAVPAEVAVCVRRQRRKEVMFATGKGGRRGQKKPRRSWTSDYSCR